MYSRRWGCEAYLRRWGCEAYSSWWGVRHIRKPWRVVGRVGLMGVGGGVGVSPNSWGGGGAG